MQVIFGNIFSIHAPTDTCVHQVADAWCQEARTVAYVITT